MSITRSRHAIRPSTPIEASAKRALDALHERGLFDELHAVCKVYAVTPAEVCSRQRTKNIVRARHDFWCRLRNREGSCFSYPEIARLFGMDHTTVLAAVRSFESGSATSPSSERLPTATVTPAPSSQTIAA